MSKQNLILLHGALGASSQFDRFIPELEKRFRVYRFDFEGHGSAPLPNKTFRMEYFAENLTGFITDHHLQHSVVFGYSMGGYAALYSELLNPGFISKIITLGTKFDWSPETAAKEILRLDPVKIAEKLPDFAEELKQRHTSIGWENVLKFTANMMTQLGFSPLLTEENLTTISTEIVIFRGESDTMVSEAESRKTAETVQNGQFISIPNLKHPLESLSIEVLCGKILGN